jgi:alkylation response protein AidB-like acyl-CoA dehydrogenase
MNVSYSTVHAMPARPAGSWMRRLEVLTSCLSHAACEADASTEIALDTWRTVQNSGLLMAAFSSLQGGEDLLEPKRHADLIALLRALGSADLSVARLVEGHLNAVALVCRYGTASQIEAFAGDVAEGAMSGVWGADDAAGLRVEIDGKSWRLNGRKILASGASFITRPVVTARTELGQIMVLPRLESSGRADVSQWTAQGMRSTATGSVDFTGLLLEEDQVLGKSGDFMRQPHFSGGAWRFCAVHLGAAERLVDLFREHLVSRGRDNDPYQLQRISQCVAATTTASFWVCEAARRNAEGSDSPTELVAFVNLTRMVTERAALDVLEAVHRGVGLNAFMRPHPIERISRDLSTYLRQPVPDLAMSDAARAILASVRPTATMWTSAHEG